MSRWDDSTGTVLYWPDRTALDGADDLLAALAPVSLRVAEGPWNNPVSWLDKGKGVFLRIQAHHPHAPAQTVWGGVPWSERAKADAVLTLAEAVALRTYNRWYALCDYDGWEDTCESLTEVASFGEFRAMLAETQSRDARKGPHRDDAYRLHPAECQVYKVHGPPWTGG